MIFSLIRSLRHGKLKAIGPVWLAFGNILRWLIRILSLKLESSHYIGSYGPFLLDGYFAFSDFKSWGTGQNNGFEACIEECKAGKCFLDVGAHIGLVTMPAAKAVGQTGSVHAFEPGKSNFKILERHLILNDLENVVANQVICGDENRTVDFFELDKPNGRNTLVHSERALGYDRTKRVQITLDSYVINAGIAPDIIKIDVEGAEVAVLRGLLKTLKRFQPTIFLSVHPAELKQLSNGFERLEEVIKEIDYVPLNIDGSPFCGWKNSEFVLKHKTKIQAAQPLKT